MSKKNILLNQFGSVLSFAIELERLLAEYYEIATGKNVNFQQELSTRSKASLKRMKNLERSRRENITEITLEPIEGLDTSNYILDFSDMTLQVINNNEKLVTKYYEDAGPKLNVLESRRIFKRCHKEHNNLVKLE